MGKVQLEILAGDVSVCEECGLCETRTHTVFARGSSDAELMFVGEGPGQTEDEQGLPFVGPAGVMLDAMIEAMGFARDDVYVCNAVKCRPPDNRVPSRDELETCNPYLIAQIRLVRPKLIIALGRTAVSAVRGLQDVPRGWRGSWSEFEGIPVLATYHPSYLLRSPWEKDIVGRDLFKALKRMGRR